MPISIHPLIGLSTGLPDLPPDPRAIARLRESLPLLTSSSVAHRFYTLLFTTHPGLRTLFPADLSAQERKLTDTLAWIVANLHDRPTLHARLAELGQRHAGYGARPEYYPIVCSLLLQAMADSAGTAWTADLAEEWRQALSLISEAMLAAAPTVVMHHPSPAR